MSSIDLLREDIARQEQLVEAMRVRQAERRSLLQQMRRALEAGASVERSDEVAAATARLQEALEGLSVVVNEEGPRTASNASNSNNNDDSLPAFHDLSRTGVAPSSLSPDGLTEEDGAEGSFTASAEDAAVVVERPLDMDALLGVHEPVTEEEFERQQRRRAKKAKRRMEKKQQRQDGGADGVHVDPNEDGLMPSPAGFDNRKTKEHLRQLREAESKQRAALFAALDRLLPAVPPPSRWSSEALSTAPDHTTAHPVLVSEAPKDAASSTCPVWLLDETNEEEGAAEASSQLRRSGSPSTSSCSTISKMSSSSSSSSSSSFSSSQLSCSSSRANTSEMNLAERNKGLDGDEVYSSDFEEDVQQDMDEVDEDLEPRTKMDCSDAGPMNKNETLTPRNAEENGTDSPGGNAVK